MRDIMLLCLDGECRAAWVKSLTAALLRKSLEITHASAAGEDLIIWKKIDFPERDFYSDKVLAGRRKCCESSLRASDMQGDEHEWKMNTRKKRVSLTLGQEQKKDANSEAMNPGQILYAYTWKTDLSRGGLL